jgi:succinate dehydrogenase / fumarate reductase cytochrome b subunit
MSEMNRPLSPHLGVYKWQVSNTLSILHRLTGVVLSVGALALLAWIISAALGREAYESVRALLAGPLGLLLLFGMSASFFYHLANGIRHLFWDAGYGFDQQVARYTGWATFVAAVLFTLLFWWGVNS